MDRSPIDIDELARIANDLFREGQVDGTTAPSVTPTIVPVASASLPPGVSGLSTPQAAAGGATFAPNAPPTRPAFGRPATADGVGLDVGTLQRLGAQQAPRDLPAGRGLTGRNMPTGHGLPTGHDLPEAFDLQAIPGFSPIPRVDEGFDIPRFGLAPDLPEGIFARRDAQDVEALARQAARTGDPRQVLSRTPGLPDTSLAHPFGGQADRSVSGQQFGDLATRPNESDMADALASADALAGGSAPNAPAAPRPADPRHAAMRQSDPRLFDSRHANPQTGAHTVRAIDRPTPTGFSFTDAPHLGEFAEEPILRAALSPQHGAPAIEGLRDRATPLPDPTTSPLVPSATPSFYFLDDRMDYFGDDVPKLPRPSAVPFNAEAVRRDFPVLRQRVNGHPLVWLDNGATTQKPQAVIDRISHFYENDYSNISRSAHDLAQRATNAYEDARKSVQRFIHAAEVDEIVFVRGTTEGINLVAQSFGRRFIKAGDEILVTHGEHHANIVPWYNLAKEVGARLRVAPFDDNGEIMLDEFAQLLNERVKIVAMTHVANALGTVLPVKAMTDMAHRHGIPVLVDGAQSISHMPIDVQDIGCDFYVFSGHKVYAPSGIGALYGRKALLDEMPPWQGGGNMIKDVTFERITFQEPPLRFEAGTGNIADAVGLAEAIKYLERLGMTNIAQYEHVLLDYATAKLTPIKGLTIIGKAREKAGVISFLLEGKEPAAVGKALNEKGIAVRAGHHCALPILRRYGVEATVRPAFAMYNTFEDADRLADAVREIAGTL